MSSLASLPSTRERIEGGLLGLLIGDALGVPYEFHVPEAIPSAEAIEFVPPAGFSRAHPGVAPGTWSDDGAQALCLLASLLHCGRLESEDFGNRLVNWYEHGYMAVDHEVFDVGAQTGRALRAIRDGAVATEAGPRSEGDNGNGSLMRVLPLALWHRGTDAQLLHDAALQSRVTHGHRRSELCCALYCLWARRILEEHPEPWTSAVTALRQHCPDDEEEISLHLRPDDEPGGGGTGYVVDTLHSARWACTRTDYEASVKAAIGLGRDTDTTAAVAGGIAGIKAGVHGIPERYRKALRRQDIYRPMLESLLVRAE